MERRSPVARPGVRGGTVTISNVNWLANDGSEPATDPDVVLSRRNKPITDLIGLGLDSPPNFFYVFFFRFSFKILQFEFVFFLIVVQNDQYV